MKAKSKGNTRIKINATIVALVGLSCVGIVTWISLHFTTPPQPTQNSDYTLWQVTRIADIRKEYRAKARPTARPQVVNVNTGQPRYFMVFSTSCSPFQDWQAMAFFHFALKVNQPGNVTRLVSGCNDLQAQAQIEVFEEKIAPLSPHFSLHITPDYGVHDNQKYWNKPNGLLDWMEKVLGFPERSADYRNDIVIIVDPDMMLLRPITNNFDDYNADWVSDLHINSRILRGRPVAQAYGFGAGWLTSLKGNLAHVVGPDSPAHQVTLADAGTFYPAGPPYLGLAQDMYAIAVHWVKFLPRVHDIFPQFMAEMHAYSIAAAHLEMPHQLSKGFMISDVGTGHEAFGFLDNLTRKETCLAEFPKEKLPFVLHFCQRYALGRWFFSKYKLREDFFECDAPLMREPPRNVAEIYDWYMFPNGIEFKNYKSQHHHHFLVKHGWMLCKMLFGLNEVAIDIKKKHCGPSANFEKTWHFHDEEKFQHALDDPSNPF
jgi:peptidyl serine alpha-galactosyltransferase